MSSMVKKFRSFCFYLHFALKLYKDHIMSGD